MIKPDVLFLFRTDTDGDTPETGGFQISDDGFHQFAAEPLTTVFLPDPECTQISSGAPICEIMIRFYIPESIQLPDQLSLMLQRPEISISGADILIEEPGCRRGCIHVQLIP